MNKPLKIHELPAAFDKINSRNELYAFVETLRHESSYHDVYAIALIDDLIAEVRLRIDNASAAGRTKKRRY